jgi:hypothetical protein
MSTAATPPPGPAQRIQAERLKYPGLLPREVIVLRNWLKLHEGEYQSFDYNVRAGQGTDPGPAYAQDMRTMAIQNSQKRIDAVAYRGSEVTLIEVKDRATASAIGQINMYSALWQPTVAYPNPPILLLVCNRIDADVAQAAAAHGIQVNIVPSSFAELASTPGT